MQQSERADNEADCGNDSIRIGVEDINEKI